MQPISLGEQRYDALTMFFHWATAVLILFQFIGAWTIDLFPPGDPRVDARSVHITVGVLLAAVVAGRIVWRVTGGRRLPPVDTGILELLAKSVHWVLYALLVAMILVGIGLVWARGDSIYNLFRIPALDPADRGLRHQVQEVHSVIGWIIIATVGLHAAAAMSHQFLLRDGVLDRMLPRLRGRS